MRHEAAGRCSIGRPEPRERKPPAVSLVGEGGIGEAITQHDGPPGKSRANEMSHVLTPRCQNQEGLRFSRDGFFGCR